MRRARYLYAIARQIQKHSRLFAVLETMDNGKPIRETRDIDIPLVARHFYYHAGWAQIMSTELRGYEPVGVVGQIIPWNFPMLMLSWKVAPALAMGNTVVLKPAGFTSLTALLFAEICAKILPPGVFNVLTGEGRRWAWRWSHADVDKIAFTGSTDVGRTLRKATAGTARRFPLSWVASPRSLSSTTPISMPRLKAWWMRSGSIRDRSAVRVRACSCRKASPKRCTAS